MKTKRFYVVTFFALFSFLTMWGKDFKSVTFHVAQMNCENCEKKVKDNIRFEKGVKEIKTDLDNKNVTIIYDADKTDPDKLVEGFKKMKYEATYEKEVVEENK